MVVRIVRMRFQARRVKEFLAVFDAFREAIRHFEGCRHLELFEDSSAPHAFATLSHWDSESALEGYRQSSLFRKVWGKVRVLFREDPEAFSLKTRETLQNICEGRDPGRGGTTGAAR